MSEAQRLFNAQQIKRHHAFAALEAWEQKWQAAFPRNFVPSSPWRVWDSGAPKEDRRGLPVYRAKAPSRKFA